MTGKFWNILLKLLPLLPTIGTIVAAVYLGVIARSGILTQDQMLKWILFILGLIATSMLIDRFTKLAEAIAH